MAPNTPRLRHARDIRSVFTAGSVAHGRTMVVHMLDRHDLSPARWTTVAGRKVGGAVGRNRAKRRLRAIIEGSSLPPGRDLVVVARTSTITEPFDELRNEFEGLVQRVATKPSRDRRGEVR